ncbi:MAG: BLUF domain-containing protein [Actinomycetota bacterium]|nr:BLUF domain-containing protein [Actinomycetota bacterium]
MSDTADNADDSGPVFRLIYKSHSRIAPEQRQSELGAIFTTARRNNKSLGVTGALVITEDAFVQALEGDESVVRDLYEGISRDQRHDRVAIVEAQVVPGRTFGRWAMAKVATDGGPDIRLLSSAQRGKIVSAGADHHITSEQETVLAFMRRLVAEGGMIHARIAYYRLRSGSFGEVVRQVEASGGLLEIFRGQPGFQSYELVETGAGLISVSHWESSVQANAATDAAATWVAGHIDDLIKLQASDTGEVVLRR